MLWSISITEKIEEIYKAFIKESGIQFSELEEQVLQFHLSNLEYACGSNLHQVWLGFVKHAAKMFAFVHVCVLYMSKYWTRAGLGKQETMVLLLKSLKTMISQHVNPVAVLEKKILIKRTLFFFFFFLNNACEEAQCVNWI